MKERNRLSLLLPAFVIGTLLASCQSRTNPESSSESPSFDVDSSFDASSSIDATSVPTSSSEILTPLSNSSDSAFAEESSSTQGNAPEGKSAYDLYVEKYPGYIWGLDQWIRDLALGNLGVTLTFDTNGGALLDPLVFCKGEQVEIGVLASKPNATFAGWFRDAAFSEEAEYSFIATGDETFFAKYIYDDAVVTFMNQGAIYKVVETNFYSAIDIPDDPTPDLGYQFVGWKKPDSTELFDFSETVSEAETVLEAVYDYSFSEIPAVVIETDDKDAVLSKEAYAHSSVSIMNTEEEWVLSNSPASIKGRGNTSWGQPKKSFRLKFDKKQSILGSSYKSKNWTLIASYSDRTLARNFLAYEMGKLLDGIAFSSAHSFVDLYLNHEYLGVYLLCDHLQAGEGKIEIDESIAEDGDNGYFIERDERAPLEGTEGQDWFTVYDEPYAIKSPDVESDLFLQNKDAQISFISGYLSECIDTIENPDKAWSEVESLIDVASFVDSYIVDELFANNDCGYSSCYFYKDKGGKLIKGPLWDFDIAAGNVNYNMGNEETCPFDEELWASEANSWYKKLLLREEFNNLVKQRLVDCKELLLGVISLADPASKSSPLSLYPEAIQRNFSKWDIIGEEVWPSPKDVNEIDSVAGHYSYLHQWLYGRYKYIWSKYIGDEIPFDGEPEPEPSPDAFKITFACDDGVAGITIYENADYGNSPSSVGFVAFSRDSVTGDYAKDGSGQVNFQISFNNGFSLDRVEIEGSYKNLKGPSDTTQADTYRITKVASDLTVRIYSQQNA